MESSGSPTSAAGAAAAAAANANAADDLFATDEFRMYAFKILPCARRTSHDWTTCPFAHPGEKARRRDPRLFNYLAVPCPDVKQNQPCPRGDSCQYCHSVFEYWLHPSRYRTQLCQNGANCRRTVCFFAHSVSDLRTDPSHLNLGKSESDATSASSTPSAASASLATLDTAPAGAAAATAAGAAPPAASVGARQQQLLQSARLERSQSETTTALAAHTAAPAGATSTAGSLPCLQGPPSPAAATAMQAHAWEAARVAHAHAQAAARMRRDSAPTQLMGASSASPAAPSPGGGSGSHMSAYDVFLAGGSLTGQARSLSLPVTPALGRSSSLGPAYGRAAAAAATAAAGGTPGAWQAAMADELGVHHPLRSPGAGHLGAAGAGGNAAWWAGAHGSGNGAHGDAARRFLHSASSPLPHVASGSLQDGSLPPAFAGSAAAAAAYAAAAQLLEDSAAAAAYLEDRDRAFREERANAFAAIQAAIASGAAAAAGAMDASQYASSFAAAEYYAQQAQQQVAQQQQQQIGPARSISSEASAAAAAALALATSSSMDSYGSGSFPAAAGTGTPSAPRSPAIGWGAGWGLARDGSDCSASAAAQAHAQAMASAGAAANHMGPPFHSGELLRTSSLMGSRESAGTPPAGSAAAAAAAAAAMLRDCGALGGVQVPKSVPQALPAPPAPHGSPSTSCPPQRQLSGGPLSPLSLPPPGDGCWDSCSSFQHGSGGAGSPSQVGDLAGCSQLGMLSPMAAPSRDSVVRLGSGEEDSLQQHLARAGLGGQGPQGEDAVLKGLVDVLMQSLQQRQAP